MNEEWRDIAGFEGLYQVSNLGRVKCLEHKCPGRYKGKFRTVKEHLMTCVENKTNGYIYVTLSNLDRGRTFTVHRLVANAFIPNPENLPVLNHKDEDKHNNSVDNLEWCTSLYNNTYKDVHLKRKRYTHSYEYDVDRIACKIKEVEKLKASFREKYPSVNLDELL